MDKFTKDIILLNMLQDIGYIRLKALLGEFKSPEAIFNASRADIEKVKGIGRKIAENIKTARNRYNIDRELSLIKKHDIKLITIFEEDYPENLKNIYDPPFLLYIKGELKKNDKFAVAIVGSRRGSLYGLRTAERLSGELASHGITIVSGLARGIDTAAHRGAVSAKGRTIAVLGNGLASIYPPENKKLAEGIAENGALISEFAMEMPPHKGNFPQRNRTISGLSEGVVVVEAARRSGSLITANFALEEGREVFAGPGPAGSITAAGTNNLIKEGAKLAEKAEDILEELNLPSSATAGDGYLGRGGRPSLTDPRQKQIYSLLSDEPLNIDSILDAFSTEPKQAKTALLKLEMKGIIKQLPGKLYVRA